MSEESAWAKVDELSDEVERLRRIVRRVERVVEQWEDRGLVPMGHYATRAVRNALNDASSDPGFRL